MNVQLPFDIEFALKPQVFATTSSRYYSIHSGEVELRVARMQK
jgi:hypothetical protein